MASNKKIIVIIDPLGNVKLEAQGFQGEGCVDATQPIEERLAAGRGKVTRTLNDSYHEHEGVVHEQHTSW